MKNLLIAFCFLCFGNSIAQNPFISEEIAVTPLIEGTLLLPETSEKKPLVIIIAGSGPTDRNGNQNMMKNNSLKFLAEELYNKGIATYRYDKRILKIMKSGTIDEKKIKFDDFIDDAIAVTDYFQNDSRFEKIFILGHSQGSLVGMIAAKDKADGFISIAGAGQEIDDVIVDQLSKQAPGLVENARKSFDDLRVNGVAQNYSPGLASIFRPQIQPFIYNWMQYNPQEELDKLSIPVLIINGDKDLQVQVSEAEKLQAVKPDAMYKVIPKMNHVLKEIEGNDLENSKSYNQYNLPVSKELITTITQFIEEN
ncbi:alpha/beta hydrolase [Marixanthomonas sp. SCSIO 43207]|uniref:alpha/beta hydrolase n=1 Tax=Marixanthomonas sp. SCSIO 43207 TaxID=2779360 RepID=UPI001CA8AC78|nr:alpha/beta hydrolase [Marixanthomonas sp. SCSIO 43207]UAB80168.1 alpha/beta hydrolase [Marixanthomonas sp. SCSIO 43207]